MSDLENRLTSSGAAKKSLRGGARPRVLITGACGGVGRACAEALGSQGAELVLCDKNVGRLTEIAEELGAVGLFCDVASEQSVQKLVTELLDQHGPLDMVVNAAGGGYERTLGMYRVSRILLPALRQGCRTILVNVPPPSENGDTAVFPYASSAFAFHRLSAALAFEMRGTPVAVMIGCPATGRLSQVLPDPNGGTWADTCRIPRPSFDCVRTLAWQIASLVGDNSTNRRRAS